MTLRMPTSWREAWPTDVRPLPTAEEMERARVLYNEDCRYWMDRGDLSDFNMGLEFAIYSYNHRLWMRFFEADPK